MPWCPKCKNEYREGFTVCADCGSTLVESIEEANEVLFAYGTPDKLENMKRMLAVGGVKATIRESSHNEGGAELFDLVIESKDEARAVQVMQLFAAEVAKAKAAQDAKAAAEAEEAAKKAAEQNDAQTASVASEPVSEEDAELAGVLDFFGGSAGSMKSQTPTYATTSDENTQNEQVDSDDSQSPEENTDEVSEDDGIEIGSDPDVEGKMNKMRMERMATGVYHAKADRAKDFRSSAWVLLIVGIGGLILDALLQFGVINIYLGNLTMVKIVTAVMFVIFIIVGIRSFASAKKYDEEADEEQELKNEIYKWCDENLSIETIDGVGDTSRAPQEILYFQRTSKMKAMIGKVFLNLDPTLLDYIVEEYYQKIYDEEA